MMVLMEIYLLRHGIAESQAATDAERDLTAEGRKKVRQVMKVAADAGVSPALVLSSPYRRALTTARIAIDELGYKGDLVQSQALVPASAPRAGGGEIGFPRRTSRLPLVGSGPIVST